MLKLRSPNFILALILLVAVLGIFAIIVWRSLGGDNALFVIIGHLAAWCEILIIFLWRKKPPQGTS